MFRRHLFLLIAPLLVVAQSRVPAQAATTYQITPSAIGNPGWLSKSGMSAKSTFDSAHVGFLLDGVVDANSNHAWAGGWTPASAFPLSVTFDLGATYMVSGFRNWHGNGGPGQSVQISVSADGVKYTSPKITAQKLGGWNNWDVQNFAPVATRYLTMTTPSSSAKFDVQEVDFYVAPTPINRVVPTANHSVAPYKGAFSYGSNMGYVGWANNDAEVASVLLGAVPGVTGAGVHSLRPALFDGFIETYGINVRTYEFGLYKSLGAQENTLFLNEAWQVLADHRDPKSYAGCSQQSLFEKNLYQPIWAQDAQGRLTVNPANILATYVAQVVSTYMQYGVRFYEVWNEPDFTANFGAAWDPSNAGFWGKVNPQPCDLINTYAPISHHVRMHRIIYEVVKTIDPTAYVATGGIGFPSYLQALLRNTDNPGTEYQQNTGEGDGTAEGTVSSRYPATGGAYFDTLSMHSYPQYDLREWAGSGPCPNAGEVNHDGFCTHVYSDAAVADFLGRKATFAQILQSAGYDGATLPAKPFIVTETNVPRFPAQYAASSTKLDPTIQQWGSPQYSANYLIKAAVLGQKNGISQIYVYSMADSVFPDGKNCAGQVVGTNDSNAMGLYTKLDCGLPSQAVLSQSGVAWRTTSLMLFGYRYDATRSAALKLPATIDGAAFSNAAGNVRFVLWAKTHLDRSETASATYTFPASLGLKQLKQAGWDWSTTQKSNSVNLGNVQLGGSPSFFF